jgi:hypothetical protein
LKLKASLLSQLVLKEGDMTMDVTRPNGRRLLGIGESSWICAGIIGFFGQRLAVFG